MIRLRIKNLLIIIMSIGWVVACKPAVKETTDPVLTQIGGENYQKYIRTPVNPDGSLDSTKMPRIEFEKPIHNFGVLEQTEVQSHIFTFTNKSSFDLYVLDVNTSCGCTVASYDKESIKPGDSGEISINYDPKNRKGIQEKKVIVTSNAYPNKSELTIIADVLSNDNSTN